MAKKRLDSVKERVFLVVIDASEEQHHAIRYACKRAASTGGKVALFKCLSPAEFQHFAGVAEIMRTEARESAEKLLRQIGKTVIEITGQMPVLYVREGDAKEELVSLINEEKIISILVLAVSTGSSGPGPLVSHVTSRGALNFRVPITLIPDTMSDEEIDALT